MNAPLPCIMRAPSAERDQTVMRPPRTDEFCLQVPHTDYLIPLPGIQNTEGAVDPAANNQLPAAVSTGTDVCTPPDNLPPSAPSSTDDGGSFSQMEDTTAEANGHWETSFIQTVPKSTNNGNSLNGFPPSSTNSTLLSNDLEYNQLDETNQNFNHNTINESKNESKLLSVSNSNENEAKLISLDTPQPTPTNIQPPVSFSTQLDAITLNPSALNTTLNHLVPLPVAVSTSPANRIDCQHCPTSGYANLQLLNNNDTTSRYREVVPPEMDPLSKKQRILIPEEAIITNKTSNTIIATEKLNGSVYHGDSINSKTARLTPASSAATNTSTPLTGGHRSLPPFTVQSYAERYADNHSEISC